MVLEDSTRMHQDFDDPEREPSFFCQIIRTAHAHNNNCNQVSGYYITSTAGIDRVYVRVRVRTFASFAFDDLFPSR